MSADCLSPTVRISRDIMEAYPPFDVIEHLHRLRVADAIRAKPEAPVATRSPPAQDEQLAGE